MENKKLIVLCGVDGAGKSTQINLITEYLTSQNKKVKKLHFPMYGYSEFSEIICKFLRGEFGSVDEVNPTFIATIYSMDRYMYKEQLLKDMEENDIVLLDRYVFSNLAFQGAKISDSKKSTDLIKWIWKFEFDFLKLPYPDLIIYLDVPMKTIEERLNEKRVGSDRDYLKGEKDIHEKDINFQSRVRKIYLKLNTKENYYIIPTYNDNGEILSPNDLFETYKKLF